MLLEKQIQLQASMQILMAFFIGQQEPFSLFSCLVQLDVDIVVRKLRDVTAPYKKQARFSSERAGARHHEASTCAITEAIVIAFALTEARQPSAAMALVVQSAVYEKHLKHVWE